MKLFLNIKSIIMKVLLRLGFLKLTPEELLEEACEKEEKIIQNAMIEFTKSNFKYFLEHYSDLNYSAKDRFNLFKSLYENYLKEIENRIDKVTDGKTFDDFKTCDMYIELFKTEYKKGHRRVNLKYHAAAGLRVLKLECEKILNIEENSQNHYFFERCMIRIKYIIFDLENITSEYENSFLKIEPGSTVRRSYSINGRKIFQQSTQLNWNQYCIGDSDWMSLSVFTLRQSIEVLLRNAFGISFVTTGNSIFKKLNGDVLIDFIKNNKNAKLPNTIDVKILKNIFMWTNQYIHGGLTSYQWVIILAQDYVQPLFYSAEKTFAYGIMMNEDYLKNKEQLKLDLFSHLNIIDGEIMWHENYEAELVKGENWQAV